ncbi:Hypothetical predicted protein [Mytilus galloprovincialis]|uniref:Uncharacterized protein n=1 Tax=Mytilus galloprovincialis TaxID=29158 RepID=A0A8B6DFL2_MYTGA|nr:Hypothetical predicted protein [Mytilus galloprovincialis]
MAEIQMQDYEEIRRKDDDQRYDVLNIKDGREKKQKDHVVVPLWKKRIKTICLALTIYMLTTGLILTVIYFTVIAHLEQKIADINMKLAAIEKQNRTKLRESENRERTNIGRYETTM